jgi:hypothetical protein
MADVKKDKKTYSIYDEDIDLNKVKKLSPKDKNKYFPNDYSSDGQPYGDF